jgi:hypothetical protein
MDITPFMVLMAKAVIRLRPDLSERISAGELTLEDAQASVARTLYELIAKNCKGRNSGEGS